MENWISFFLKAGISSENAKEYAEIFARNRIKKSHLSEMTKEYLKDMAIHAMGDILYILRHCKVHSSQDESCKPSSSSGASASFQSSSVVPKISASGSSSSQNTIVRIRSDVKEPVASSSLIGQPEKIASSTPIQSSPFSGIAKQSANISKRPWNTPSSLPTEKVTSTTNLPSAVNKGKPVVYLDEDLLAGLNFHIHCTSPPSLPTSGGQSSKPRVSFRETTFKRSLTGIPKIEKGTKSSFGGRSDTTGATSVPLGTPYMRITLDTSVPTKSPRLEPTKEPSFCVRLPQVKPTEQTIRRSPLQQTIQSAHSETSSTRRLTSGRVIGIKNVHSRLG
jgi:hypothetical protein